MDDGESESPALIRATSLADIPVRKGPKAPKVITLDLGESEDGTPIIMEVVAKYPENIQQTQLIYLMKREEAQTPDYDASGAETFPKAGAHELYLRQQTIVSPPWLKNDSAFKQFVEKVEPQTVALLHQELSLVAGLDARFFDYYRRFTASAMTLLMPSIESVKDSDSSPTKSKIDAPAPTEPLTGVSSPVTTTTVEAAPLPPAQIASETNSGSLLPTPTIAPQIQPRRPTLNLVASSQVGKKPELAP